MGFWVHRWSWLPWYLGPSWVLITMVFGSIVGSEYHGLGSIVGSDYHGFGVHRGFWLPWFWDPSWVLITMVLGSVAGSDYHGFWFHRGFWLPRVLSPSWVLTMVPRISTRPVFVPYTCASVARIVFFVDKDCYRSTLQCSYIRARSMARRSCVVPQMMLLCAYYPAGT